LPGTLSLCTHAHQSHCSMHADAPSAMARCCSSRSLMQTCVGAGQASPAALHDVCQPLSCRRGVLLRACLCPQLPAHSIWTHCEVPMGLQSSLRQACVDSTHYLHPALACAPRQILRRATAGRYSHAAWSDRSRMAARTPSKTCRSGFAGHGLDCVQLSALGQEGPAGLCGDMFKCFDQPPPYKFARGVKGHAYALHG